MSCYILFLDTKLWVAFGNQKGILGGGDCELIAGIYNSAGVWVSYG